MKKIKKVQKPLVTNEYTKASQDKMKDGLRKGNNEAIAEILRRMGI